MDAEVKDLCGQLRLTKLEQEEIHVDSSSLEEVILKGQNYLVTKLLKSRPYNREAFKATMKKIWRLAKIVRFHKMGNQR